ncbi:ribonuclease Z, partial [uncultured Draconibacterium sp.]|uniref:ribonuclease Z n=1 Tax=uncultured Draconibacterium sp. TaxID=1573823 RepID=UPI002631D4BA
ISFSKIRHIFISHLHGDHYYGLIGLLSTMNLLGVKSDVHIYAPSELKTLIQPQLDFIRGEMSIKPIFHPLNLKKPQTVFENKNIEVLSFPVKHSIPTVGFLFREKPKQANIKKEMIKAYNIPLAKIKDIKAGADFETEDGRLIPNEKLTTPPPKPKSYAFCTDTAFHPPLAEIIEGVDLLYHEATFLEELKDLAGKTLHSTARQAAEMAKLSKASKLLIGHFSSRFKNLEDFKTEAREVFKNTELAIEGKKYMI